MRLVFMGTPDFSVPTLKAILDAGHEVVRVYSQPPAPKGRGQKLSPSPVHQCALDHGLRVFTPENMKEPQTIADFQSEEIDALVVVAFGQILTTEILEHARYGAFNLHASLLPRWRGAAPIHRAILAGDKETGVDVMRMSLGLDEGPVVLRLVEPINDDDTTLSLHDRLKEKGALLMLKALKSIENNTATFTVQTGEVTYAKKIKSSEARLDFTKTACDLSRQIRALSPFPGAFCFYETPQGPVRLKILFARETPYEGDLRAGTLIDEGKAVVTSNGALSLIRVQREGRAAQSIDEFLHANPFKACDRLE